MATDGGNAGRMPHSMPDRGHEASSAAQDRRPGDCPGCGVEYPHCDCSRDENVEAEAREGYYTAMGLND